MTPLLELVAAYVAIMWSVMTYVAVTSEDLAGYTAREKLVVVLRSPLDWPLWRVATLWSGFKLARKVKKLSREWAANTDEVVVTSAQELLNLMGSDMLRGKVVQVPEPLDVPLARALEVCCSGCVLHLENVTFHADFNPCLRLVGANNALLQPSLMFPAGYPNLDSVALRGTRAEILAGLQCLVETEDDRDTLLAEVCIYEKEPDEATE